MWAGVVTVHILMDSELSFANTTQNGFLIKIT